MDTDSSAGGIRKDLNFVSYSSMPDTRIWDRPGVKLEDLILINSVILTMQLHAQSRTRSSIESAISINNITGLSIPREENSWEKISLRASLPQVTFEVNFLGHSQYDLLRKFHELKGTGVNTPRTEKETRTAHPHIPRIGPRGLNATHTEPRLCATSSPPVRAPPLRRTHTLARPCPDANSANRETPPIQAPRDWGFSRSAHQPPADTDSPSTRMHFPRTPPHFSPSAGNSRRTALAPYHPRAPADALVPARAFPRPFREPHRPRT
ncbi:hypothetical protein B0H17DRAFT_1217171 [Mycena rosella]|uniref:Uncharacterized protein n=1 Tax=Mycena rosella TaxID=1033263 RepID=A0AAD7C0W7_MYCRO|nr:hypothetical protein B0H17DRAFT_1217171 [Mycena rosella]